MKTFIVVIGGSIVIGFALMAIFIWVAIFLEELNFHWTTPIDLIADHAEKTARHIKNKREKETK